MLILFYDTETSGLFKNGNKPYCLQIGAGLYDDELDNFVHKASIILNHGPDIKIDNKALAVHGIDHHSMSRGMTPLVGIRMFHDMVIAADQMIGFNMGFDKKIMKEAYRKEDQDGVSGILDKPHFDIMEPLTPVCKLPGKYGYKWPKLTEAYKALVDEDGFEGAHDAFADIMATFELWKWCNNNDITLKEI